MLGTRAGRPPRCVAACREHGSHDRSASARRDRRRVGAPRPHRARRQAPDRPADRHRVGGRRSTADLYAAGRALHAGRGGAGVPVGQRSPPSLLAAFVALVPFTERLVLRVALVVFCLPLVATRPALRVVYGHRHGPQVTLAALAVFYTTLVPLLVGLRAVPQTWSDLVASYGRGRLTTLHVGHGPGRRSLPRRRAAGRRARRVPRRARRRVHRVPSAASGCSRSTAMRALRTDELWAVAAISAARVDGRLRPRRRRRAPPRPRPAGRCCSPPPPAPADVGTVGGGSAGRCSSWLITVAVVLVLWDGLMRWFDLNPLLRQAPEGRVDLLGHRARRRGQPSEILDALGKTAQIADSRLPRSASFLGAGDAPPCSNCRRRCVAPPPRS